MAAAAEEVLEFYYMDETELRQWVEANPGRVNDIDRNRNGHTPLIAAACHRDSQSLVVWLLEEKGADVNALSRDGNTPLHIASSPDVITALLDRGADPARVNNHSSSPLM